MNHRVFAVRTYFESKSTVETQRRLSLSLIFLRVMPLRAGAVRKSVGPAQQRMLNERESNSLSKSARGRLTDVKTFHEDLSFHPYKIRKP